MEGIQATDKVLIISSDEKTGEELRAKCPQSEITLATFHNVTGNEIFDVALTNEAIINNELTNIFTALKANGKLVVLSQDIRSEIEFAIKTNGFINMQIADTTYVCQKPGYQLGSSAKLTLTKSAGAVWKLDDEDDDTIDPENLLDEDDLKKPTIESLRVCGTTGKRKACKDCSCGLAEELAGEKGDIIDTSNAPKSSCGSCYLGDAFRCATCPYLGMPAFKPGEKVQLIGDQLQDDI